MADQTMDDYIAGLEGWQADVAAQLRQLVHEVAPGASEAIKWKQPTFEHHGLLCYFKALKKHMNFGFFRGAELDDPKGLLEGTGGAMRHIKITGPGDFDAVAIAALVKSAKKLNESA